MKFRIPALTILLSCAVLSAMFGATGEESMAPLAAETNKEPEKTNVKPADEAWKNQISAALKRRVSFEFVETSFDESVTFLRSITGVTLVIQPGVPKDQQLSLQVRDMPVEESLTLLCKLVGAEWKPQNQAIVIDLTDAARAEKKAAEAHAKELAERLAAQQTASQSAGRLRIKLANGNEIEAEGAALRQVGLGEDIKEALFDPAKDGMLCVPLPAAVAEAQLEEVRRVCDSISPKVKLVYNAKLQMLIATGDDPRELRRVGTLLRQLKTASEKSPPKP